jgi:hypothetical protein
MNIARRDTVHWEVKQLEKTVYKETVLEYAVLSCFPDKLSTGARSRRFTAA